MKSSLIIEASDRLAWHQRLASEASTVALWGGWLWLWAPLLKGLGELAQLGTLMPAWGFKALVVAGPSPLHSLAAIAGTSGTLVAWRHFPRVRAKAVPALPLSEYARRFELGEQEIEAGRRAAVCVVHHHPDGRIARIECRAPEGQAAA
jgi:poly-beta-1,6-N-acetyl-D-glucosamine biosynthesis protein PgaD